MSHNYTLNKNVAAQIVIAGLTFTKNDSPTTTRYFIYSNLVIWVEIALRSHQLFNLVEQHLDISWFQMAFEYRVLNSVAIPL